ILFALRSQAQLRTSQSQSLAYAAESLRTTNPETALLLASEALLRDDNVVTAQTMRDTLDAARWQPTALQGHTSAVSSAVFSTDVQRILAGSDDNTARVWDLSGKELATLQGHTGGINSAVFSPDGQRILTTSDDNTARVWDLSGKELVMLSLYTS